MILFVCRKEWAGVDFKTNKLKLSKHQRFYRSSLYTYGPWYPLSIQNLAKLFIGMPKHSLPWLYLRDSLARKFVSRSCFMNTWQIWIIQSRSNASKNGTYDNLMKFYGHYILPHSFYRLLECEICSITIIKIKIIK